jgi:hypothetical protein
VFLIGKNTFGFKSGFAAGLLHAICPELIFFSTYLYAETILEFILALGTLFIFTSRIKILRLNFLIASLILGIGVLFKHFVIVGFSSLIILELLKIKIEIKRIISLVLVFSIPYLIFSVVRLKNNQDPFLLFNAAIKNSIEWNSQRVSRMSEVKNKIDLLKMQSQSLQKNSIRDFAKKSHQNLRQFWNLDGYHSSRLLNFRYGLFSTPWPFFLLSALFFYGVMSSGFLELISGDKILFKTYVLSCFGLLSLMCCFFFMVSRYKTPFLFLVIILAGNSLIYFKQNLRRLRLENLFRKTIYLSLFLFISLLYGNSIINRLFN